MKQKQNINSAARIATVYKAAY